MSTLIGTINDALYRHPLGPAQIVMSLRDPSQPADFGTGRLPTSLSAHCASGNMRTIARLTGYPHEDLVLTEHWSHLANIANVTRSGTVQDSRTGTLNPCIWTPDAKGNRNSADALITRMDGGLALGLQTADCPPTFIIDPVARLMAAIHCGWKPVAQWIIESTVDYLLRLGAKIERLEAFIGPGAGDDDYEFTIDDTSYAILGPSHSVDLFRRYLKHQPSGITTLELNRLVYEKLLNLSIPEGQIAIDYTSCISYQDPATDEYLFQSYRRDKPNHGLALSVIWVPPSA